MAFLFEIALDLLLPLVIWTVLFPVVWLLVTPVILLAAIFWREPYQLAVLKMYGRVTGFWKDWGLGLIP